MTQNVNIATINSKTNTTPYSVKYNNRYTPPMPEAAMDKGIDDVFMMQEAQTKKAQKQAKSKERWYKTGICAQVGLAVAFGVMAGISLFSLFKQHGKGAGVVKDFKFEDFSKKENFPSLDNNCVNEKVRKFIKGFKKKENLKDSVRQKLGISRDEQCLLMYGPPGTGKTFSAKLLAHELGAEYGEVQFADVSSIYVGQTSVEIKKVFDKIAENAKKNPTKKYVTAFNEIDALLVPREKCGSNSLHLAENRTAFLNGLDQIRELKNVKIVGTTNVKPDSGNLDKASLSRFANIIEIGLPDEKELTAALEFHLRNCSIVKEQKFFENEKDAIEAFVKNLKAKKYSQRDVEDIALKAIDKAAVKMNESANPEAEKFTIEYLKDAVKEKGQTTGTIDAEAGLGWIREALPLEIPKSRKAGNQQEPQIQTKSMWQWIKSFFTTKN